MTATPGAIAALFVVSVAVFAHRLVAGTPSVFQGSPEGSRGLLRLDPDLRPFSEDFERFVLQQESEHGSELEAWERVEVSHSWHYTRMVLVASGGSLALCLLATQPSLQASLLGIATGITGAITAGLKLRDTFAAFMSNRKSTV